LKSRGIFVVKEFKDKVKYEDLTLDKIENQIYAISEFHKRTLGYTGVMNRRLDNNIGRDVEQYKMYTRKFKKDIDVIKESKNRSIFLERINQVGEKYLIRSQSCLDNLCKNHYMGLILRSMDKIEMCLKNTCFDNLRKNENIEVIDVKGCCYNMVEMDAVYFLSRLKRKGTDIDFASLVDKFCRYENLDESSIQFILSMLSYPYEFMKCYNRYKYHTKNWNEGEYLIKLNKAIYEDGDSLI
jgi:hypothetical protein